jgi:hypothetical protein
MSEIRRTMTVLALAAVALAVFAAGAEADFGFKETHLVFEDEGGSPVLQAGAHPFAMATRVVFNDVADEIGRIAPDGAMDDLFTELPEGFAGVPTATPRCTGAQFVELFFPPKASPEEGQPPPLPNCPAGSPVGYVQIAATFTPKLPEELTEPPIPVYNLVPGPGTLAKFGFVVYGVPIVFDITVSEKFPYRVVASFHKTPQPLLLYGATLTMWGNPLADAHDAQRGACLVTFANDRCEVDGEGAPLITMPTSCGAPPRADFEGNSWQHPEVFATAHAETDDGAEPPTPIGLSECSSLDFAPGISASPTSKAATSPTGLDFGLTMKNEGILDPKNTASSTVDATEVTLPEGFSINPSVAEGLEVCSEAQLARETAFSEAGAGCPNASKLGTVEVETPVLEETVKGALYQAAPYENPFHSLVALYIVLKNPTLGIKVVQPLNVIPDPVTGRLTTVAEDMPQLPFSHFRLHFREGTRSPLATPPSCDADPSTPGNQPYNVNATLYPWSGTAPVNTTSAFEIITGPDNSPCPKGGLPPFHPELTAGTVNNAASSFSPFNVKITRTDSEQEIDHFSIKLPTGVAGKLAGIPFCSDAQIARATARTGPHGGQEELNDPSCPAASQVGRSLAGSGVGSALAYAPGKLYLAGPYHGAPISFVSITSGVVGPFDIGTVVVRLAIKVNPETGEVFLDSTGSDPIPHIIHGIPIHLRDIRAYTDRPNFTFNPTSCERKSTAATVLGSGLDFASEADDNPFVSTSPFQAADCAALPFAPKLSLKLIGGTKRGAHPALKAFLRMNGFGEAGVAHARVTLPRSEFIENAHFNTICTRAQFKLAGGNGEACPSGSIYGWARAKSPILSEALEGPIFLRSSEHQLPDVVAALRGQEINVHLVGHVDSVKGQLRNTFETVPDAPVEWASFSFQGQKKGLFVNSTNLCKGTHKAKVELSGQNGKQANYGAPLQVKCKGHSSRKARSAHKRRAR